MSLRPGLSRVANRTIAALEKIRDSREATPAEKLEAIQALLKMLVDLQPREKAPNGEGERPRKRRGRPPKIKAILAPELEFVPKTVDQSLKNLLQEATQEKENGIA